MQRLYRWGSNKYIIYAFHLLFWMLLIFPFLSGPAHPVFFEQMKYRMILQNSFLIVLFYCNAYYLYPRVFKNKGAAAYLLTVVLAVGILMYISAFLQNKLLPVPDFAHINKLGSPPDFPSAKPALPPPGMFPPFFHFPIFLFIIGISFSYRLMADQSREEKKRKEQETENLKTELSFLRSQISPHFMFNILNTLVALARKKSDLMEPSLIQLSNMMRYVLYESNHNRIALSKEVAYLRTYVELQSLRFGDDLRLRMDIDENTEGYEIEPMLLIPFVENAFKHGLGSGKEAQINISLKLQADVSVLHFHVVNEIGEINDSKDTGSGIGLKNVNRRLELLYTDKYRLNTMIQDFNFIADLKIELQ